MAEGKTKRRAPPRRRRGEAATEADVVARVLRAHADGDYAARVDVGAIRDPMLAGLAAEVNVAAEQAGARQDEVAARMEAVRLGVDEAIDAMVRLVVQGDLTGSLRLAVTDAALTPLIAGAHPRVARVSFRPVGAPHAPTGSGCPDGFR